MVIKAANHMFEKLSSNVSLKVHEAVTWKKNSQT